MTYYSKKDLVKRLRTARGYTARDAQRSVSDVLGAMLDLVEVLEPGESLNLEHIGSLTCGGQWRGTRSGKAITFRPSALLRAHLKRAEG